MAFQIDIVTPSKRILSQTCDEAVLPSIFGEIGIMTDHAALLSLVGCGAMRIREGTKQNRLAIRGGFVQVFENKVTVLADEAVMADDVVPALVEEEKKKLDEKLLSADVGADERIEVLKARDWVEARLLIRGHLT